MRILASLIAAACCLAPAARADTIKFRTLCFRHNQDIKKVFAPGKEEGGMIEVPLYTSTYSDLAEMRTIDGQAKFYLENPDATDPKDAYREIASARVTGKQMLFLFLPKEKDSPAPYQVTPMSDDTRSFPWGHLRIVNLSPSPVRFHLGEHSGKSAIQLDPGKIRDVGKIRKLNQYNLYNVVVEFANKDGFIPVSNTRWKCAEGKRDIAIAFIEPTSKQPVVNLYKDVRPAELP